MRDDFDFNTAPTADSDVEDENQMTDAHGRLFAVESDPPSEEGDSEIDSESDDDDGDDDDDVDGSDFDYEASEGVEFIRRINAVVSQMAEESDMSESSYQSDEYREPDILRGAYTLEKANQFMAKIEGRSKYKGRRAWDNASVSTELSNNTNDSWEDPYGNGIIGTNYTEDGNAERVFSRFRSRPSRFERRLTQRKFPQFARLPTELRLRVWEMHCTALFRSNRVVQVYLHTDGQLDPSVTLAGQTKAVRRFMRICRETRAMGERMLPDTLPLSPSKYNNALVRFNAETDLVHFLIEHPNGLVDVDFGTGKTAMKTKKNKSTPAPYTNVRNLAIYDVEVRSRAPGAYHDNIHGHTVVDVVDMGDTSHQRPEELRSPEFTKALEYLFPNLENVYVVERGATRRSDRWVGHWETYQRYHVREKEPGELFLESHDVEYLYCWHAPPKQSRPRRQGLPSTSSGTTKQDEPAKGGMVGDSSNKGENSQVSRTNDEKEAKGKKKEESNNDDGDFKDDCVINHFVSLRDKGVRFSRLLIFELNSGMRDYIKLLDMCSPFGDWPIDDNGDPVPDHVPSGLYDEYSSYDSGEDEEDDSIVVSDDDEDEEDEDDSEEDDDLAVLQSNGDTNLPLEAMFSSPDAEDDDDEEEEEDEEEELSSKAATRDKRRRIITDSDDDDHEEDGAAKKTKTDDDGDSSHTEAGDQGDRDEDEQPKKPSVVQMPQRNR